MPVRTTSASRPTATMIQSSAMPSAPVAHQTRAVPPAEETARFCRTWREKKRDAAVLTDPALRAMLSKRAFGWVRTPRVMAIRKTDRDKVIDCALRLFREKGYHATSMADISEACGLLKGSIYHYFPGKKELAAAALDR